MAFFTSSRLLLFALFAIAPLAFCQSGSISGTVVDSSGGSIANAQVTMSLNGRAPDQQTQSAGGGIFSFLNVDPGSFRLTFTANGFTPKTITGELPAGETVNLSLTELSIAPVTTGVVVTQAQVEIAQEQIQQAETQRLIGLIPNFFANYNPDAAPLNTKQKFELSRKFFLDPSAFVITGIIAGVGQARDSQKGFGQGTQGYAKRYGAAYANFVTGVMVERLVMPTLFKQDPRYFVKGTGTKRSRFYYAISRSVICQGDNRKPQFCYSGLVSRLGTDFLTNYYYPASSRNSTGTTFQNAAIGIGAETIANLFQEFVARKITRKKP